MAGPVQFAHADEHGARLIPVDTSDPLPPVASSLDRAICADGKIIEIKPLLSKASSDTDRNTSDDGAQEFVPVTGSISGACLLAGHAYLSGKRALPVLTEPSVPRQPCNSELASRVPSLEGRAISACSFLGTFTDGESLVVVEYQPQAENLLAAFVLITPSGVYTHALPAKFSHEGSWRVEDEGKLYPEAMDPLFAFVSQDATEIAINWDGIEGESLVLYRSTSPGSLEQTAEGYRHH